MKATFVLSPPRSIRTASTIQILRQRLGHDEAGFTLIELLVVLVIMGILLAVAVPSYLGVKDRAKRGAAQANVRSAVPAVEAYYSDRATYAGIEVAGALTAIDGGVTVTVIGTPDASTYCISNTQSGFAYYKNGPAGEITTTVCS